MRWLLERPGWTPLARLTYLAYLLHPVVIIISYGSDRAFHIYSPFMLINTWIAFSLLSYMSSFIGWYRKFPPLADHSCDHLHCSGLCTFIWAIHCCRMALEKPLMNLEKLFLPQHRE
jgi:thiosulfate reductase cytochrome b subunit